MNKIQENDIKSSAFQDSLMMLGEAIEYLKKLPAVPATYHLIKKIEVFLQSPESQASLRISKEHSQEVELRKKVRAASLETVLGLPVIEVEVQGDLIKMHLPFHHTWRTAISRLKKGVTLNLKPLN